MGLASNETDIKYRSRLGLFLARFCTSAWIGAAILFVIVGVTEVTRSGFDSATKDTLVAIRFPAYYVFGTVFITTALIGILFAGHSVLFSSGIRTASAMLLSLVLVMMIADYIWIYLPLLQMITPPGQAKPASFVVYHEASKWINLAEVVLCLITATLLNWPFNRSVVSQSPAEPQ